MLRAAVGSEASDKSSGEQREANPDTSLGEAKADGPAPLLVLVLASSFEVFKREKLSPVQSASWLERRGVRLVSLG